MSTLIVGVDPGGTTGVFAVAYDVGPVEPFLRPVAAQIRGSEGVAPFVDGLAARMRRGDEILLAVEAFVIGGRTARSSTPGGGRTARALIEQLTDWANGPARVLRDIGMHVRPAATVKPWATDKRLDAAGLLAATKGMPHARDAARQALYAAVHAGLIRDPLSKATAS